jgi:hypothetical protein
MLVSIFCLQFYSSHIIEIVSFLSTFFVSTFVLFATYRPRKIVTQPAFVTKSSTAVNMIPLENVDVALTNAIAQNSHLIATSADENGGYFYPVAGLALLAALILYLSPPLAD